jgi:succinate dehydrogenase flavin-adding protein (antitoxin of CptAB toxin-antitoxin module)
MKDNKSKSNRAQADYFELLVGQYICSSYGVTFSYSIDLAELSNKVLKLDDGAIRLKLQNDNLIKLEPEIKKILDYEIIGKGRLLNVIWTGRNLTMETTSDIEAEHLENKKTKFSIKSIASGGKGTLKNLGLRKIQKYYNINFLEQNNEMWEKTKEYLTDLTLTKSTLKKRAQENEDLFKWVRTNGQLYQKMLNNDCFKAFNKLSNEKKVTFLNFITDCKDDDLYVVIANSFGASVYKPVNKQIKLIDNICAKEKTETGYSIFINNLPVYRVQTNNTNGIGISPFCQRFFLI